MSMKLVSVNIEGRKHLKTVGDLLEKESPDVVCLMEVCREDVLHFAGDEYPFVVFAQNDVLGNIGGSSGLAPTGVAILSKTVMIDVEKNYLGEQPRVTIVSPKSGSHAPIILTARIGQYQVGAIHFTWSRNGEVSPEQREHIKKLMKYLSQKEEMVLCGDFNIPRGNELYQKLLTKYQDNVPAEIESTLDPILHYANQEKSGRLKLVVDYVWTCLRRQACLRRQGSPKYKVENVRVESGVSDHCALVCKVSKVT